MLSSFAVLALLACKGEVEDTDTVPTTSGEDPVCTDSPPRIEDFEVRHEDMSTVDDCNGGVSRPRIRLAVHGIDDDGDLTDWEIRAWWDTEVDGVVDTTEEYRPVNSTLDVDPCEGFEANLGMIMCVDETPLDFETTYEFGVVLLDNLGNESADGVPAIATFTTPAADGTYSEE